MTALVDLDLLPRRAFLSTTFALPSFTSHAQAFGHEPNALPKLCNLLRIKILAPRGGFEPPTFLRLQLWPRISARRFAAARWGVAASARRQCRRSQSPVARAYARSRV